MTFATLGLTTCNGGCGVEDPLPPPPLVCKDANRGQNLMVGEAAVDTLSLNVQIYSNEYAYGEVDTAFVADVTGATFDSMHVYSAAQGFSLYFTLDSLTTGQVTFTLKGTYALQAGPCNFQRTFTVTIDGARVEVAERLRRLPLEASRDVRIELVERDGLRVSLRAAVAGEGTPVWNATAGKLERLGRLGVVWELPPDPGYYQIEVSVDRGTRGVGFDAVALEVT